MELLPMHRKNSNLSVIITTDQCNGTHWLLEDLDSVQWFFDVNDEVPPGSASLTDPRFQDTAMRGKIDRRTMSDAHQMQVCSHP